ncbi:DAK2 domain-containing protein [Cellulomonas sp. APG4]|uniref:DAK2 domain-containing protein n=1 Tax=Cellulomonas sp. APG4 TaxID=1538656 RepID=UPI00137A8C62|nr:DAK2 domain-containing protein [Cellulomonas sp. APG4]
MQRAEQARADAATPAARVDAAGDGASLDAAGVRRWAEGARQVLADRRHELDALNVFPVADSDTGTNLYLTFAEAAAAVGRLAPGAPTADVVRGFARASVRAARGNSGVIVGQYVAVLCAELAAASRRHALDGAALARALERAAEAAHDAVAHPVEGTVLTVAREVEAAAGRLVAPVSSGPADAVAVLDTALDEGLDALARTSGQLPVLAAAGVHDAGAWGLLLILEALAHALGSSHPPREPLATAEGDATQCPHDAHAVDEGGDLEVMYLVAAPAGAPVDIAHELRTGLDAVGGSVAVVGAEGLWQAHVHTDDAAAAIAVPRAYAALGVTQEQVSVRHLLSQSGVHGARRPGLGLVAVTTCPGLAADLARAGAVVVVARDGVPSDAALDRALDDTGADRVLVLSAPGLGEVRHRGGLGDVVVDVLDAITEVQLTVGAATLASGARLAPDTLLEEVRSAVDAVRCVEVPAGADPVEVLHGVVDDATAIVTVLVAEQTPPAAVEQLRTHLRATCPGVELVELPSGRSGAGIVLGVE